MLVEEWSVTLPHLELNTIASLTMDTINTSPSLCASHAHARTHTPPSTKLGFSADTAQADEVQLHSIQFHFPGDIAHRAWAGVQMCAPNHELLKMAPAWPAYVATIEHVQVLCMAAELVIPILPLTIVPFAHNATRKMDSNTHSLQSTTATRIAGCCSPAWQLVQAHTNRRSNHLNCSLSVLVKQQHTTRPNSNALL